MCDPSGGIFTTLAMVASGVGAGVSAYANIQRGNAEYAAGMYNAQIADRNAQQVVEERRQTQDAAAIERRRLGERVRADKGALVAKFAHMGLDTEFGTPADLVGDVQRAYDIDRSILGTNEINKLKRLDLQEADYKDSAQLSRSSAKSALKGSRLAAAGSLLSGVASVSGRWIQPSPMTTTTPPMTKPKIRVGA